jgi:dihydropteroate synthase
MARGHGMAFEFQTGQPTKIMGILNITPDSFSDGGHFFDPGAAVERAQQIQNEGAAVLDIGAQSTRPGFTTISREMEWERLNPVLKKLSQVITIPISIDTFYPYVAERALEAGADIINDVSGVVSPEMAQIVKSNGAAWIFTHNPEWKPYPTTSGSIVAQVRHVLMNMATSALDFGLRPWQICADPGIGFGKTMEENLLLIKHTNDLRFAYAETPIAMLVGLSRKRVVDYAIGGGTKARNRLGGSVALQCVAQLAGADYLRTHDVQTSVQAAVCCDRIMQIK